MTVEVERNAGEPAGLRRSSAEGRREGAARTTGGSPSGGRGGGAAIGATPARVRRIAWQASATLAIATAATAVSGWRLAEPLAVALALGIVVAVAAGIGRGRNRGGGSWENGGAAEHGGAAAAGDAARAASLRAALRIGVIVILASGVIVALSLERRYAAAGMAMTVAILSIVGAPAWLAVVSDERARAAHGPGATEPPAPPDRARRAQEPREG
ncbi:MAG: hypothetical protein RI967_1786 [Planctomycetota bacterium]